MAQIKCRHFAVRTKKRVFTAKDVGRIAKYAIQDGASEKAVVVQVALRVGYLRDWLLRINELVKKVLPVIESTTAFLEDTLVVLKSIERFLVAVSLLFVFVGLGEVLAVLVARIKVFEKRIDDLRVFVADIRDLVETFDISEVLSDTSLVKGL